MFKQKKSSSVDSAYKSSSEDSASRFGKQTKNLFNRSRQKIFDSTQKLQKTVIPRTGFSLETESYHPYQISAKPLQLNDDGSLVDISYIDKEFDSMRLPTKMMVQADVHEDNQTSDADLRSEKKVKLAKLASIDEILEYEQELKEIEERFTSQMTIQVS